MAGESNNDIKMNLIVQASGDGAKVVKENLDAVEDATQKVTDATEEGKDASEDASREVVKAKEEEKKAVDDVTDATNKLTDAEQKRQIEAQKSTDTAPTPYYDGGSGMPGLDVADSARIEERQARELEALREKTRLINEQIAETDRLAQAEEERARKAAKAAQDEADVIEAKRRVTERAANAPRGGLGRELATGDASTVARAAAGAAIAATAKLAGETITEVYEKYRMLNEAAGESPLRISAFNQALIETIAVVNNPLQALKEAMMSVAGLDNFEESLKWSKEVKENYEKQLELMGRIKEAAKQMHVSSALDSYKREADELERQERAIQRINGMRSAHNDAANEIARANVTIARNTGGDVVLAEAKAMRTEFDGKMSELRTGLEDVKREVANKQADAVNANVAANNIAGQPGMKADDPRYKDARAKADAAQEAADAAAEDISAAEEKFQTEKNIVITRFTAALSGLENLPEVVTTEAQKTKDSLRAAMLAEAKNLSDSIPQISGEASAPVTAKIDAAAKGMEDERRNTAEAISRLPVAPQNKGAIEAAGASIAKANDEQTNEVLKALTKVLATTQANTQRISGFYELMKGNIVPQR